jgi:hypothetical protein
VPCPQPRAPHAVCVRKGPVNLTLGSAVVSAERAVDSANTRGASKNKQISYRRMKGSLPIARTASELGAEFPSVSEQKKQFAVREAGCRRLGSRRLGGIGRRGLSAVRSRALCLVDTGLGIVAPRWGLNRWRAANPGRRSYLALPGAGLCQAVGLKNEQVRDLRVELRKPRSRPIRDGVPEPGRN